MPKDSGGPVVVAVGGSVSGRAAIQLAATEAGFRNAPLIAVTAYQAELRAVPGLPGRKLVETARATNAQMIVLASGFSGSELAGAVSQYVLRNAPCPVLVVPGMAGLPGRVD